MGSTDFEIALDGSRSGPPIDVPALRRSIPNPAVIVFERAADGFDVTLTLEMRAGDLPELVALEVSGGGVVSGSTLRAVRVAQLTNVAHRYLALPADDINQGRHLPTHYTLHDAEDFWKLIRAHQDWRDDDYLPPLVRTSDGYTAKADWVAKVRAAGPSSELATRSIAATYRLAARYGTAPNLFVERVFGFSRSTASHWIKLARRAGTLSPATRKPRSPGGDSDA